VHDVTNVFRIQAVSMALVASQTNVFAKLDGAAFCAT